MTTSTSNSLRSCRVLGGHGPVPSMLGGRPVQRAEADASVERTEPHGLRFYFLLVPKTLLRELAWLNTARGRAADDTPFLDGLPVPRCCSCRDEHQAYPWRQGLCTPGTGDPPRGPAGEARSEPGGLAGGSPGPLGRGPDFQGTWEPPSHSQGGQGQTWSHTKCRYLFWISLGPLELHGAL